MNVYPVLVFLHVLGGPGIFVALTIEAVALGASARSPRGSAAETQSTLEWKGARS